MGLISSLKEYFGYTPSDDNGVNGKFEIKEGAAPAAQPTAFAETQKTAAAASVAQPLDTSTLTSAPELSTAPSSIPGTPGLTNEPTPSVAATISEPPDSPVTIPNDSPKPPVTA